MSERLTSLERTVLAYKDPQELPKTDKFLIVETGALAGPMLIPVDTVAVSEHEVRGLSALGKIAIEFSPLYAWYVVPQDAVEAITHAEMLRRHKADRDEARKLNKELWGNEDAAEIDEDGPKPVGQYL